MFRAAKPDASGSAARYRLSSALNLLLICAAPVIASEAPEMELGRHSPSPVLPVARGLPFEADSLYSDRAAVRQDPMDESILAVVAEALRWRGVPYAYGGSSMAGTDCSGYVGAVLAKATGKGKAFPRSSSDYAIFGEKASAPMSPGDILLFARDGAIYHVGIALSASTFIHSASEGARRGVIISSLDDGSWRSRLVGMRRLAVSH